jgi:retinaldehyde-binding protein 1
MIENVQFYNSFSLVHILAQLEKSSQINGVVVIMDYEGLSLKQIKAITPAATKRLLTFIQEAMLVRLREVHFVKQPFIFNMVWTLFKPFVKEKLKNRVRKTLKLSFQFIFNESSFTDVFSRRRHEEVAQAHSS